MSQQFFYLGNRLFGSADQAIDVGSFKINLTGAASPLNQKVQVTFQKALEH